jgi:RNAse (barnase) inhibitor barstar
MEKLNISCAILGVVLLASPCVSSDSLAVTSPSAHHSHHLAKSSGSSHVDSLWDNLTIEVSGRTLKVELDNDLKQKLIEDRETEDQLFTKRFREYFENTKRYGVSDEVMGFIFGFDGKNFYSQTFLGENAD